MTARISKNFTFQAGVYFNDTYIMNVYDITLQFNIQTETIREQNVALERIRFFLRENIESVVFVDEENQSAIDNFVNAGMRVCALPEEPFDQIIGIMLMCKINAIMENRMDLTDISITSWMSDGVMCHHADDESLGPFVEDGWWNDPSPKAYVHKANKSKKLVKLVKSMLSWEDAYLGWEEQSNTLDTTSESEVVFVNFDKKSDKIS